MKKGIALLLTIALAVSAMTIPALAEQTTQITTDQTTSATVNTGKTGRGGRQQMPGNKQRPGNGQIPQQPGQGTQTPQQHGQGTQTPQQPDQNAQTPQQPNQNGRQGKSGKGINGKHGNWNANGQQTKQDRIQEIFDQLLKDGVISQEVYDAIMNYLKEHLPQLSAENAASAESSELPVAADGSAPVEGSEPPALPDGSAPVDGSEPLALPDGASGAT